MLNLRLINVNYVLKLTSMPYPGRVLIKYDVDTKVRLEGTRRG